MRSIGYLLVEGIKSLWKNRTMSFASIAVLISCLLLTGVAVLLSINMDSIMQEIEEANSISVYIQPEVPVITSIQIGEEIRSMDNIATCEYITKEEAMESLKRIIDDTEGILDSMESSFLPYSYSISLKDVSLYEETIAMIYEIDGIRSIDNYEEESEILSSLDQLITYASIAIVSILAAVSLFIISNTVKVTMFSRRVEISIMKSVGATNTFIRIPFIVEGIVIGVLSGLISAFILFFGYDQIVEFIYSITPIINAIDIDPYMLYIYLGYALLGSFFGIMGGVISISRYLKREGENAVI